MPITYPDLDKPKLKLAFAMGGGVSLGAFSGSALTEVIKLALLKIADGTAEYGTVEIDVFSGASAGSLSIAVMLRGLSWRMGDEEAVAKGHLFTCHPALPAKWDTLPAALQDDLIAAQVAQDLQGEAWVGGKPKGITMDDLLGAGDADRAKAMQYAPGLLDAEAVYHLARRLFLPPGGGRVKINRRLLGQRCLFAPTLTNLTPLVADATTQFTVTDKAAMGLRDALRSQLHKDMRVFDLHFKEETESPDEEATPEEKAAMKTLSAEKIEVNKDLQAENKTALDAAVEATKNAVEAGVKGFTDDATRLRTEAAVHFAKIKPVDLPGRWFRMHEGEADIDGSWALSDPKCWAEIAATAIASGAFPGAFQPAVLTRNSFEYGPMWPKELKEAKAKQHPFAYVDGGVFNNDPIRETFRLCSFMDARETSPYQRYIVYVDPSVGPEGVDYHVAGLREVGGSQGSFWNIGSPEASAFRPTLPRLASLIGSVVGMLVHQGRSRDVDGVAQTRNYMAARTEFRSKLRRMTPLIAAALAEELFTELRTTCTELCLELFLELIPPGEGTLPGEMRRVIHEENLAAGMADLAETYFAEGFVNSDIKANCSDWLWVHLCVYFDLLLGLEGKMKTTILAITPYEDGGVEQDPKPVKLLGDVFAAFGGFMWDKAQQYDFDMGRYCAGYFVSLDTTGPLVPTAGSHWLASIPGKPARKDYAANLTVGMEKLRGRIEEAVGTAFGPLAKGALALVDLKGALDGAVEPMVAERYSASLDPDEGKPIGMEFMILLKQGEKLQLDASGIRDRDADPVRRQIGGAYNDVLITWASFENGKWSGGAVQDGNHLLLQKPGTFWQKDWAIVKLPDAKLLAVLKATVKTHLRPVVMLNLNDPQHPILPQGETPTIDMENWKVWEGAVPLSQHLQIRS